MGTKFIQLFGLVLLSGCGVGDLFGGGRCDLVAVDVCVDYAASVPSEGASASCSTFKSSFSSNTKEFNETQTCSEAHPSETPVGSCVVSQGAVDGSITYYEGGWDAASAAESCATTVQGSFVEPG